MTLQCIIVFARKTEFEIKGKLDCKHRDFHPQYQTYTFIASYAYTCKFPMSISHYYQHKQYCVHVDYVYIGKSCPIEMRIYEGLNSWHKIPKVTLTCDSTIANSFCVWGSNAGIYIEYTAYRSSNSFITLKIVPGEKPRTTTSFTPNDEDSTSLESIDMSSIIIILTLVFSGVFVFVALCYCCCCRKTASERMASNGSRPQNYRPQTSRPVFSDATSPQQQSILPPRGPNTNPNPYDQGPPDYMTTTSLPLVQPSAPPLESHQEFRDPMICDPPPSYDSVVNDTGRI